MAWALSLRALRYLLPVLHPCIAACCIIPHFVGGLLAEHAEACGLSFASRTCSPASVFPQPAVNERTSSCKDLSVKDVAVLVKLVRGKSNARLPCWL